MIWIAGLFAVFLIGVPIAFALGFTTLVGLLQTSIPLQVIIQRMFTGVDNFALIAIPLFILAGNLMAVGGISKRITSFSESLVGHWPGGLGMVAVLASMIFAAVTGSAIAATAAIGGLLIPEMIEKGYSRPYSASLIATSGSIGPIIPPSIPLVVYGVIVSSSIAKLFMGGVIPGILMGLLLMLFNWRISKMRNYIGRPQKASIEEVRKGFKDAILALLMPVIVIGGIVGGIFTPTESAGAAVLYILLVDLIFYRSLFQAGKLFNVLIRAGRGSAVFKRSEHSQEAELAHLPQGLQGEVLAPVPLGGIGFQLFAGEIARHEPDHLLFRGNGE